MPKSMTEDVANVIVRALQRGLSRSEIAGVVGVSRRAITRISTNLRLHGAPKAPPSGLKQGRPIKMTEAQAHAMLGWMAGRDYTFYIKDLTQFLKDNHAFAGCDGTVRRALLRAGFKRKLPAYREPQQSPSQPLRVVMQHLQEQPRQKPSPRKRAPARPRAQKPSTAKQPPIDPTILSSLQTENARQKELIAQLQQQLAQGSPVPLPSPASLGDVQSAASAAATATAAMHAHSQHAHEISQQQNGQQQQHHYIEQQSKHGEEQQGDHSLAQTTNEQVRQLHALIDATEQKNGPFSIAPAANATRGYVERPMAYGRISVGVPEPRTRASAIAKMQHVIILRNFEMQSIKRTASGSSTQTCALDSTQQRTSINPTDSPHPSHPNKTRSAHSRRNRKHSNNSPATINQRTAKRRRAAHARRRLEPRLRGRRRRRARLRLRARALADRHKRRYGRGVAGGVGRADERGEDDEEDDGVMSVAEGDWVPVREPADAEVLGAASDDEEVDEAGVGVDEGASEAVEPAEGVAPAVTVKQGEPRPSMEVVGQSPMMAGLP
ncbi:hypothetical protein FH972_022360 [Carpinus fangiana]|uniref:Winged helix-turn helix domain-containing protein n=1 Tax=Carpinus fangiana TaxID=176857 RepID=A0A5N6KSD0_9ROSI|nr:hypothetical protein FH972_022360 [Carpinus fangiana]